MIKPATPHNIQALVDQQVRKWNLQKQMQEAGEKIEHWPLITVSREEGSLGAALGGLVAKRLDFSYWDREIVTAIAKETRAREAILASLDEHKRNELEDAVAELMYGTAATKTEYFRQLVRVIQTIDHHGRAVVVGRGARFIVDQSRALCLRIVCPFQERVRNFAEREQLAQREAEAKLRQTEQERRAFIHQHFRHDVAEPSHYDLYLNTSTFSLEDGAELVIVAYQKKFGRLPRIG